MSVLDLIKSIASNGETGRLEINASGTPGTLLFHEGKLVDARLGSLSGFQAVNAAVALRDVEVNFDHVAPASHVSTITPNERVILSRFFGIEAADMEEPQSSVEPDIDWNPAPEPVVPLAEAATVPVAFFSSRLAIAACLALLIGVAVGAVALRSKVKTLRQSAAVASAVASESSSAPDASHSAAQVDDQQQATVQKDTSSSAAVSKEPVSVSQPLNTTATRDSATPVTSDSSSRAVNAVRRDSGDHVAKVEKRDANMIRGDVNRGDKDTNVRDLNGEWRVINTVEKTGYRSFDKLQVGFRLTINQNGKEFTAKGEKFFENGETLPVARRTPIQVKGSIDGDKVIATFIEDGRMRRTNGRFVWKLQNGGDGLTGTFVSSAANSSGRSAVTKRQ